jgi:hypothetical protein
MQSAGYCCPDRCTDEDGYCSDKRRNARRAARKDRKATREVIKAFFGFGCFAVVLFGGLIWYTVAEWEYLTTPPTAAETYLKSADHAPAYERLYYLHKAQEAAAEEQATAAALNTGKVTPTAAPQLIGDAAPYTQKETEMMARLIYGEAGGIAYDMERAAVAWCVLNRLDDDRYPDTIAEVITQPHQFYGYDATNPLRDEDLALAKDVLNRYYTEKAGAVDAGRILPKEYICFTGEGSHNFFEIEWRSGIYWDWSASNPYED